MLQAINFNRLVIAVVAITAVAAAGFLSTRAFFSDTETATGNVFAAGSLDLMIGIYAPDSQWPDVAPRNNNNQQLFSIAGLIPGEKGEGYFRLQATEDAWACMSASMTTANENTRLSQEESAGDNSDWANSGELQNYVEIAVWETNAGNNDGKVGPNEVDTLKIMSLADFTNGNYIALQDSADGDNPLVANTEYEHEFAYCFGQFVGTPGNMASYVDGDNELTCDGGGYGSEMNRAQTDGVELVMSFYAEQMQNNDGFVCSSINPDVYFNGFETDTNNWTNLGGTVTRVAEGTNGVPSSDGDFHATLAGDGAYTQWGGYSTTFPLEGYTTEVDVYLDMSEATGSNDLRFDFSSAINNSSSSPTHRRDFIFHLGTNPTVANQWFASASNNAPGWPGNPAGSPVNITTSGWYTLQAYFHNVGGVLAVEMNILDSAGNTVGSWTRSDPSDTIPANVGGNRYGWFLNNDFGSLPFDNARMYLGSPN